MKSYDLNRLGVLKFSGEDHIEFLQNQLTSDVTQLASGHSQLAGFCTPKGRMQVIFRLIPGPETLYAVLPKERIEFIKKRLQIYVLMAKVTIEDISGQIGLQGIEVDELPGITLPKEADDCLITEQGSICRLPGQNPRYLLLGFESLDTNHYLKASWNDWLLEEIRAGLPMIVDATSEAFVPQMANLHLIKGVSFDKGCYTGQEIVARMQYLGNLKRQMYRIKLDQMAEPGTQLYSASSKSPQGSGKIVLCAQADDGFEALAVIENSSVAADDLQIGDVNGSRVQVLSLPYL